MLIDRRPATSKIVLPHEYPFRFIRSRALRWATCVPHAARGQARRRHRWRGPRRGRRPRQGLVRRPPSLWSRRRRRLQRIPTATPTAPPMSARRTASERNWVRMWPLVAPSARRKPISERRSRTEIIMMLATPTAPTRRATAPRPRNRPLSALCGVGVGDERLRGLADVYLARGFGVGRGGRGATAPHRPGRSGLARRWWTDARPIRDSSPRRGYPTRTEVSMSGARTAGFKIPTT